MTPEEMAAEIARLKRALYEIGFTMHSLPQWYRECARHHLGRQQERGAYDPAKPGARPASGAA